MLQPKLISCVAAGGTTAGALGVAGQPPRAHQSGSPCSVVKPALSVSLCVTQQSIQLDWHQMPSPSHRPAGQCNPFIMSHQFLICIVLYRDTYIYEY